MDPLLQRMESANVGTLMLFITLFLKHCLVILNY